MLPVSFNGIEVDMLSLGDADSILVSRWANGSVERVLIDGGAGTSVLVIRGFLSSIDVSYLDHVVVTHPHGDHADGVVELLRDPSLGVGKLWFHVPFFHVDIGAMLGALRATCDLRYSAQVSACLERVEKLQKLADARGIPYEEPFAASTAGFLTVCGPSVGYYRETIAGLQDPDWIRQVNSTGSAEDAFSSLLEVLASAGDSEALLTAPLTSPENNLSVVLAAVQDGNKFLFTGDAGAQGLLAATTAYDLRSCYWMQLPHHGSRRNITQALIDYFCPRVAYVSAAGSLNHPRRALVNALKKLGAVVYSTHYPNGSHLRSILGTVPPRAGYGPATQLWEAAA